MSDDGEEHVARNVSLQGQLRQPLAVGDDAVEAAAVRKLLRDDQLCQAVAILGHDLPQDARRLLNKQTLQVSEQPWMLLKSLISTFLQPMTGSKATMR